jgi:hypothetical protein
MTSPSIAGTTVTTGALGDALLAMFSQLVDKVLGQQTVDKNGKPLRDVCYMHMPNGLPIEPRDFADPWTPDATSTIAGTANAGQAGATTAGGPSPAGVAGSTNAGQPTPGAPAASQKAATPSQDAARRTAELVDERLLVTSDGSYMPYQGSELISSAYQLVISEAFGIPAPPPPAQIQQQIDAAQKLLWVEKPDGTITGRRTPEYQQYEQFSQAWANARTDYANAESAAAKDPALGNAWPVTSSSLQMAVDNAWNDWRGDDADEIENALDTLGSVGGSVGTYFVSQAKEVFKAWDLGLTGVVPVGTLYSEVLPSTWYDPTDEQNGFSGLTVSASQWQGSSASASASQASNWYKGHCDSTSGGGGGMIFGITLGVDLSKSNGTFSQGSQGSGGTFNGWSSSMSNVSIEFEWGLCNIYRPWLLSELFIIDGWYLPNEPMNCISDGTVGGAVAGQQQDQQHPDAPETHMLPMVTTQFLVVRNVTITADGWGAAGQAMSSWCADQQSSDQSSSSSAGGGVGFLCLGGTVSQSNADWSGQASDSANSGQSFYFSGGAEHGTLTINGCQIVGWVGEILPASPRVDGTKETASGT